ncbi:MAG: peptidylprolyl isomerase [Prevotellaceae bacterium]|jgi:peptidyl-prolyl cis-trans isomerase SurA|nr:peptidylprolyl isomerase [Prevotellaceae bacterium]
MIKKLTAVFVFFAISHSLTAQMSVDKVVGVVGNEAILESDVELLYKDMQIQGQLSENNPKCEILSMLIEQKLLVAQAKFDSIDVNLDNIPSMVDRKIAATIAQVGSKELLESYYNKTIEQWREEAIEFQTEQSYAQNMTLKIGGKVKVTPNEVERFFKTIDKDSLPTLPDQYMLLEIVKKPNSERAVIDAKEKLLTLRKRIIDGEKFQTLATMYSEDPASAVRGGEVGLSPLEGYVPAIRLALSSMRVGQISKIIESEYGFHIVQLLEKHDENGLVNYRHILLKPKYTSADRKMGFARLDSIVRKIKSDSISFEQAAVFFSDNEKSRTANGLVVNFDYRTRENRPYFYKDELNPEDFKAIEHIGVGEMSDPYTAHESGNEMYKIVFLKEFIPSHKVNLKDDFSYIANIYENKKQMESIKAWVERKSKTEYIKIDRKYKNCPSVQQSWVYN